MWSFSQCEFCYFFSLARPCLRPHSHYIPRCQSVALHSTATLAPPTAAAGSSQPTNHVCDHVVTVRPISLSESRSGAAIQPADTVGSGLCLSLAGDDHSTWETGRYRAAVFSLSLSARTHSFGFLRFSHSGAKDFVCLFPMSSVTFC